MRAFFLNVVSDSAMEMCIFTAGTNKNDNDDDNDDDDIMSDRQGHADYQIRNRDCQ